MKSIFKNTAILLAITLVAAVVLSYVYQLTKDPIAQAEIAAKEAAYQTVYPEAKAFETIDGVQEDIDAFNETLDNGASVIEIMRAVDGDTPLGYVLTVNSKKGYGGNVKIALGVNKEGTVMGYSVLDCSGETAGFGARAKDTDIAAQFPGITSAEELDGISGATHTTEALKTETQAGLDFVKLLEGGVA